VKHGSASHVTCTANSQRTCAHRRTQLTQQQLHVTQMRVGVAASWPTAAPHTCDAGLVMIPTHFHGLEWAAVLAVVMSVVIHAAHVVPVRCMAVGALLCATTVGHVYGAFARSGPAQPLCLMLHPVAGPCLTGVSLTCQPLHPCLLKAGWWVHAVPHCLLRAWLVPTTCSAAGTNGVITWGLHCSAHTAHTMKAIYMCGQWQVSCGGVSWL
jgi:hypothetical protein